MLVYDFGNYEGFNERFGLRECGNGEKSRRNKILLSFVKNRDLIKRALHGDEAAKLNLNITNMDVLWMVLKGELLHKSRSYSSNYYRWDLCAVDFYTGAFQIDDYEGLCEDGDARAIRYVNADNGRVFKMRAGKFMRKVCEGAHVAWPEQVLVWFCEEFATRWQAYAAGRLPNYTLHVERSMDAFRKIYDSAEREGDFHSCMTDQGYHSFYYDAVAAKAAWLENEDGKMVARCVIFTEVRDENTGEVLRLAERQYSTGCSDLLKRVLVDKLIAACEIDGYKRVGADCHNARAFVGNDGSNWSDRDFSIRCELDYGDTVSYQDSFKWWNDSEQRAYNSDGCDWDEELDTTSGVVGDEHYDSWHECYTSNDVVTVYYHGRSYECDECRLDEFRWIERGSGRDEYHHEDDCDYCDDIDEYVLMGDAYYSEILDKTFYYESDMASEEEEYKAEHWTYSEYDEEYFEDSDDVVKFIRADGEETTICRDSLAKFDYEEVESGVFKELVEVEAA